VVDVVVFVVAEAHIEARPAAFVFALEGHGAVSEAGNCGRGAVGVEG
jgi:hypothetical protein